MWTANPDVLVTDLGDELVLMHPAKSEMFSLNAAGRLIWQGLPATTQTLAQTLQQTYEVPEAQASADVGVVLDELQARDLLRHA